MGIFLFLSNLTRHFVPNITLGAPIVKCLRKHTDAFMDCHLMVSEPEKWVDDFASAGASQYCFHIEAAKDVNALIDHIKSKGMKVGIAVKPGTAIDTVFPYCDKVDMILVMTVEPGFGGQSFMADMMPKVKTLRERYPKLNIEVDGGLAPDTVDAAAKAGANCIVAGSSVFKSKDCKETISILREAVKKYN